MNEIMKWFQESEYWATVDASFTIVSILITLGTFVMVVKNYRANKKQLDPIKIFIKKENTKKELHTYIVRKYFTRPEIKGILSELHDSDKPYKIKDITKPSFLKTILDIQQGKKSELTINIHDDDDFKYNI